MTAPSPLAPPSIPESSDPARATQRVAKWSFPDTPNQVDVAALMSALHLPENACRLLVRRGYADTESAKNFLRPRLEHFHDPALMLGMSDAVSRLARAVRDGELICIHGDYDVDGICSTTILVRALRAFGARAIPFIPRRIQDGYDLSLAGVNAAIEAGVKLLVTCDCGTNAVHPVRAASEAGIDVIISDHHLPSGPLPDCVAVLNPRQQGCAYPDKELAAVGIAFKLALALAKALGVADGFIYRMLDLVALATIADIAPLRGENRIMARFGLKVLGESENVGLRSLIRAAGLEDKPLTAGRVGYVLAPRLNAVGRLAHALRGVELLMTDSESEANTIARELEELNRRRQAIDRDTVIQAMQLVDQIDLDSTYGLVLAQQGWHPGVIGIVASRVVEQVCRPTVLVALSGGEGKGSGRSIPAFDLHAGLSDCRDLLVRFGGHRAAAGVTVRSDRVADFADRFNRVAMDRLAPDDLLHEVRIDLEIRLADANAGLESLLRHFEPFGTGNPSPVLVTRSVMLACPPRSVGDGHAKLRLSADGAELDAIGFGLASMARTIPVGTTFDVAFRLESDDWNGDKRVQAKLAGIRF
ncbi:MAG: single-stranded-DNA-specific exonuclease RecJ [Anaerolineae bacterium]|nr:single-stranded-DNA-specific exonuclease RecJ [Gemmatimonadaceae bacterium]